VRTAKDNTQSSKRYYRPEQMTCLYCHHVLERAYPIWRKYMIFLRGRCQVVSIGYRCPNSQCRRAGRMYMSQAAQRLTIRGSSFALEVIVQIGYWRFWKRWTVAQIHEMLTQAHHLPISEREVLYLIEVFLVLLRCTYHLRLEEHAAYFRRHGLFIAIDALKPEKGNRALYVVRELRFGLVLHQVSLLSTAHQTLVTRLFRPVKALGYRVRGWVSDDEKALRLAAAIALPGVSHQTCQSHCLRDAAVPIMEADQALKKALKQAIRSPFYTVCRAIDQLTPDDPCQVVLSTYADLIRATLTEGSKPPFALGGLRVFEDLTRLEGSLQRSRKKGGIQFWINSWPSSNVAAPSRPRIANSNANGIGWSNWTGDWIRPSKTISPVPPAERSNATSKHFWLSWNTMPKRVPKMRRRWRTFARRSGNVGRASSPATLGLNAGAPTMTSKVSSGAYGLANDRFMAASPSMSSFSAMASGQSISIPPNLLNKCCSDSNSSIKPSLTKSRHGSARHNSDFAYNTAFVTTLAVVSKNWNNNGIWRCITNLPRLGRGEFCGCCFCRHWMLPILLNGVPLSLLRLSA
jgi:hypothetical protein